MKYSSQLGCLFYYDRVLYNWKVCDSTMIFLLGFESILGYNSSSSDTLKIVKSMYDYKHHTIVALDSFDTFDSIYSYLSQFSSVEDNENYATYSCNGIKLLLNDLSGTGVDRTVPIIFHSDVNHKAITLDQDMCRIIKSDYTKMSTFDLQSQKILDIFDDAGFSSSFDEAKYSLGYIDTSDTVPNKDEQLVKEINEKVKLLYDEKIQNSNIYKLIDYCSMYAYSLGVLYGCRCLGYSKYFIWRLPPSIWYNGENTNLVTTAWNVFRFYYLHHIEELEEDPDKKEKYQSIVENDIWNFTNDASSDITYKQDEELVYKVTNRHINEEEKEVLSLESIIYSKSTEPESAHTHTGSYLYDLSKDKDASDWHSVDEIISNESPKTGIITSKYVTRYIGDKEIKFYPAYDCGNDEYLSPNSTERYFILEDLVGWVPFDEDLWRRFSVTDINHGGSGSGSSTGSGSGSNSGSSSGSGANSGSGSGSSSGSPTSSWPSPFPTPTLSPRNFYDLPSGSGINKYKGVAKRKSEPYDRVGYYKCFISYDPQVFLYGIYTLENSSGTASSDKSFDLILLDSEFANKFSIYDYTMYDSTLKVMIDVGLEESSHIVILDNEEVSFEDFYSNSNYGIIREILKVFNPETSSVVLDCYHDTNESYERYCIPHITDVWKTRQEITDLGYIFVDGTTELYNGDVSVNVVYDDDDED